jgi:hypothetical protein
MGMVVQTPGRFLRDNQQVKLVWQSLLRAFSITGAWIPQTNDPLYRYSASLEYLIREKLGRVPFLCRYSNLVNHLNRHSLKFVIACMRGCEQCDYLCEHYRKLG